MEGLEGVDRLLLSGTSATLTMKGGAKLAEKTVRAALEKNSLEFVSLEERRTKRAAAAWVASTPGLT